MFYDKESACFHRGENFFLIYDHEVFAIGEKQGEKQADAYHQNQRKEQRFEPSPAEISQYKSAFTEYTGKCKRSKNYTIFEKR